MNDEKTSGVELASLQSLLEERQSMMAAAFTQEIALADQAMADKATRLAWWEGMITDNRRSAEGAQLSSYSTMAKSLAGLLGGSIRDQAKIMVPFEIAEATREFGRFLSTRDPGALASSLKHALAAKQYAAAAKSGGGAEGSAGGGSASPPAASGSAAGNAEPSRQTRVIVNVGRQVGLVDTYEFARNLIDAINENMRDDVILEVAS
jgi:hypothetical protein